MISEIKKYVCEEDGSEYYTMEEAEKHKKFLELRQGYENIKLCGKTYGGTIDFEDLVDWIIENKAYTRSILSVI